MDKNKSLVSGLVVFGLLFASLMLNVVWFPATTAAKVRFFEGVVLVWIFLGVVSSLAAYKYMGPPATRKYCKGLITVLCGPIPLIVVYRHVTRKGGVKR